MTERCRLCDEPAELGDLCFQCEDKTLANFLNHDRRFMIEGRKTGFQPVPGVTWPKQALAEFRSMLRYRHHDLQLIEVPETAR